MSLADIVRQKEHRLTQLRAESKQLEAELEQIRKILNIDDPQPPNGGAPAKPRGGKPASRHGWVGGKRKRPIRDGSSVHWAVKVLKEAGQPLHIDELIQRMEAASGTQTKKPTLVSNLSRYVKFGDTFVRTGESKYGLK